MKKSKVTTAIHTETKQWNGKDLQKYTVAFENGESGTLTVFPNGTIPTIGLEMEYEIIDNGYGAEIKIPKKGGAGGGFAKWTPEQVAQQDAVKLTCAFIENRTDIKDWKQFFVECKSFMVAQIKAGQPAPVTPQQSTDIDKLVAGGGTVDDLPF